MYDNLISELRYYFSDVPLVMQAADAIEELQKRKHGEWILVKDYSTEEIEDGEKYWVCSLCGCGSDSYDTTYHTNFCPSCGADMREPKEREA